MNILKWIWPTLGDGFTRVPRNVTATKKGPGRRHKTGHKKSRRGWGNNLPLLSEMIS